MPLATFSRFHMHIPGVSIDYSTGETTSFTDSFDAPGGTVVLGMYCQHIFEMQNASGAYTARERGMFGIHYLNTTSGSLDTTWTSADFAAVESAVQTLWSTNAILFSNQCRLIEHRWYPYGPGVTKPNPAVRDTILGTPIAGSDTAAWTRQVAATITWRTALRKHWGRIYLPLGSASTSTTGQMTSARCDTLATSARTMLTGPETSQGVVPVVYDRVRGQALGITAIEVDSVPDIIRRRRPRDTAYRKIITS